MFLYKSKHIIMAEPTLLMYYIENRKHEKLVKTN